MKGECVMSYTPKPVHQFTAGLAAAVLVLAPAITPLAHAQVPAGSQRIGPGPVQIQPRLKGPLATELSQWQAMQRNLSQIRGMQLRPGNLQDLQAVGQKLAGLKVADPYAVMVNAAVQERSFQQGVQQAAEREGAQKLADRIRANPRSVMDISGAQAARQRAVAEVSTVAKEFEALGQQLQRAAVATTSEVLPSPIWQVGAATGRWIEPVYAPTGVEEAIIIAALVGAATVIIAAYAQAKAEDFQDREEKKDTRSDFKKCTDNADAKADRCKRNARGNWFKIAACNAQWSFDISVCWTFPQ